MPVGDKISDMYGSDISSKRNLGQFYMAIRIDGFVDVSTFKHRLKVLADAARHEPARDPEQPVLFPGDPEKNEEETRIKDGIPMSAALVQEMKDTGRSYGVEFAE
jgi:LDH2 family malate/lactate/ureidoglycolate dehydrogenase